MRGNIKNFLLCSLPHLDLYPEMDHFVNVKQHQFCTFIKRKKTFEDQIFVVPKIGTVYIYNVPKQSRGKSGRGQKFTPPG